MALLTAMGRVGQKKILADVAHMNPRRGRKNYRSQIQEVLSALNSDSPKSGSCESGINVIHHMIHDDLAYLILCDNSLSETEAFKRLQDLIQFKSSLSQGSKKDHTVRFIPMNVTYQRMLDDFYAAPSGKVIKTPEFVSSENDSDSESEDPTTKKYRPDSPTRPSYKFLCSECGYGTMFKQRLVKHYVQNCPEQKGTLKCPEIGCEYHSKTINDLDKHLTCTHGRELEVETKELKDESELDKWLIDIQLNLHSRYVLVGGGKTRTKFTMSCSRGRPSESKYNRSSSTGKRKSRVGSNKSDKVCTSRIKVECLERGALRATFYKTHSGHSIVPGRISVPMPDKIRIAGMLKDGVPKEDIIKKIRDENSNNMNRLSLLNSKDIDNIIIQFKLGRGFKFRAEGKKGHSRRPKPKVVPAPEPVPVRLGFEGNEEGEVVDGVELMYDIDNLIEIEQEFNHEAAEVPHPQSNPSVVPSENESTVAVTSSDMDEVRTLFSTVYSLVQSRSDVQFLKNGLQTIIAHLKTTHTHSGSTDWN